MITCPAGQLVLSHSDHCVLVGVSVHAWVDAVGNWALNFIPDRLNLDIPGARFFDILFWNGIGFWTGRQFWLLVLQKKVFTQNHQLGNRFQCSKRYVDPSVCGWDILQKLLRFDGLVWLSYFTNVWFDISYRLLRWNCVAKPVVLRTMNPNLKTILLGHKGGLEKCWRLWAWLKRTPNETKLQEVVKFIYMLINPSKLQLVYHS